MENLLDIRTPIVFDESICHYETHAHQPYATSSFRNNDEIHIAIQHQDQCLLPSRSSIHIQGKFTQADGSAFKTGTVPINNAICFLFSEIRYELNAIEIDKCKNVGITSLMKAFPSINQNQLEFLESAGWNGKNLIDEAGNFEVLIPLNLILGFAEDYQRIIVNAKHELILTRSNDDTNAMEQSAEAEAAKETFKFTIIKIEWLMPNVILSNSRKSSLLKFIEKDPLLTLSFRSWELFEYPELPKTSRHIWTVKTSTQLEKPRFVILGFQSARNNSRTVTAAEFDHCNISNVKLFLNSQYYPYGNMNLDMKNNQFALLYEMFAKFQESYYGKQNQPIVGRSDFKSRVPLIVFDCSKQNENLKSAPVDVRLEFEASQNFPAKTAAFCLIIHDRIIQYKPISGDVKKLM